MFDRASIIGKLCRRWIQQGRLSEREWLRLQEMQRNSRQELEDTLLSSPQIHEEMLLEGLSEELGCRFWRGPMLNREVGATPPPLLPVPLDFFAHKQITPLSWDADSGTLHLVMARLPSHSLLQQLQSLLPIAKLHLELASKEAIVLVLGAWMQQSSRETSYMAAAGTVSPAMLLEEAQDGGLALQHLPTMTQPIETIVAPPNDPALTAGTAPTHNAPAFEPLQQAREQAPDDQFTIRQSDQTSAWGAVENTQQTDSNKTFAILAVIPAATATQPAHRSHESHNTLEEAPPPAYPGNSSGPPDDTQMWEGVPSKVATDAGPTSSTPGLAHSPNHRLPSGDLQYNNQQTAVSSFGISDDEFFLDYQSPATPTHQLEQQVLPTAQGGSHTAQFNPGRPYAPPAASAAASAPQVASPPVLDLFEEFEEFADAPPSAPPPAVPSAPPSTVPSAVPSAPTRAPSPSIERVSGAPPQQSTTPAPSSKTLAPSVPILPSDDELFGKAAFAPATQQPIRRAQSPSRAGGIAPAPMLTPQTQTKRSKVKGKNNLESFLLRNVLGTAVGLVNLLFRFGAIALIGYLVWYLFLSR